MPIIFSYDFDPQGDGTFEPGVYKISLQTTEIEQLGQPYGFSQCTNEELIGDKRSFNIFIKSLYGSMQGPEDEINVKW